MAVAGSWRDRLISCRFLALAILGLGVIRLVVALALPQTPSPLAPDEGTYAALAAVVASGGDWASWSSGWGAGLYPGSRALLGPAALLIYVGLPDMTAIRVVSVAYAVGAQLLLLALARLARQRIAPDSSRGLPLVSWPMLGIAVFVFLPSNVLWSNLGLREAACAFWVLGAVVSAAYLFASADGRAKALWSVATAVSVSMAFQSRTYLATALVLALATGIVWLGKERPRVSFTLAASVALGAIAGLALSSPGTSNPVATSPGTSPSAITSPGSSPSGSTSPGSSPPGSTSPDAGPSASSIISGLQETLSQTPSALNPLRYVEGGSYQREVSALYADSAIAVDSCVGVPDPRSLRWCELSRLPGAAFAVMFRPLWPLDRPSQWSGLAVAASAENIAWLALVAAVAWLLATRRFPMTRTLTVVLVYGALVVGGMALLEGNFGTAFRHKSNTLWALCAVLVLAGSIRTRRVRALANSPGEPMETPAKIGPSHA